MYGNITYATHDIIKVQPQLFEANQEKTISTTWCFNLTKTELNKIK